MTQFVAFGDSITAGEDGESTPTSIVDGRIIFFNPIVNPAIAYPTVLEQALKARYGFQSTSIHVSNHGTPGLAAADPEAADSFRGALTVPGNQVILIMIGTNDLYEAHQATDAATRVTQALNAIQSMARSAKAANLRVYVSTIPPMNSLAARGSIYGWELVSSFNDRVRGVATVENVNLVDVYAAFRGDLALLGSDGVHPNALGYQRIANTFFDAINSTLADPTAPAPLRSARGAYRLR
jgi:lysophospholipase L1-like esterase